jgi:hypothetical protein
MGAAWERHAMCESALRVTNAQAVKANVSIVTGYRKDDKQQTRGVCAEINMLGSIGYFVILNSLHIQTDISREI